MKYCDLCQAFYLGQRNSGLKDKTSQKEIAKFFVEFAVDLSGIKVNMPSTLDSYAKWYAGSTNPRAEIWDAVKHANPDMYARQLEFCLDRKNIDKVAANFGLDLHKGEIVDITRFSHCVTKLLLALANEGGETKQEFSSLYREMEPAARFSHYINYAQERYNLMKLIGGDEVQLEKYFVCNSIGEKIKIGVDRSKIKTGYVDDATIEKIRTFYQKRGVDNRKVLLLGSGGSGKTLMLQHLLLESMERFNSTGILPVFLELRDFLSSDSIVGFITETLNRGGGSFSEDDVIDMLRSAKLHVLFDGLDEVDPSDVGEFQKKIDKFAAEYRKVMIIIASRECDAKKGLHGFIPLYVWPFDNKQSMLLIDKILENDNNSGAKEEIVNYLEHGFIKRNGVFASHPMMLTYVARNYPRFDRYRENHLSFYEGAYKALLSGHDDNKKPYDRIFKSVDNAEDFTKVFAEFCAKSYERGEHEFDDESFGTLFDDLQSYKGFENTHKMNEKNFKQDACSTACMMYEEDSKTYYIDPGFQKYLFAHYYIHANENEMKAMGKVLLNTHRKEFDDYEAFDMIYDKEKEKFETCILFPFLQAVFKGKSEKDSLARYLELGYEDFLFTVIYGDKIAAETDNAIINYDLGAANYNEPRTILLDYIFEIIGCEHATYFLTGSVSAEIDGAKVISPVYGRCDGKKKTTINISTYFSDAIIQKKFGESKYDYIKDGDGAPMIMGNTYLANTQEIIADIESYDALLDAVINEKNNFRDAYFAVKAYYELLSRSYRKKRDY